jgi:UDP-glucose 4-epimerase
VRILVTGAAGFIASHIAYEYIKLGHEVFIIDNLATGKPENINPQSVFYHLDIRSTELDKIITDIKPDIVNHHAAQISVPLSVKDPVYDTDVNVNGTINLLESCVKHKVSKIIFASSGGAIYGEAEQLPTPETCALNPLSPYAVNKAVCESFLSYYKLYSGLDFTILRYANVYGPRQISHGEAGVVAIFIEKLLNGEQPVLNAYPDQPEGMLRDYVFVQDVVAANVLALAKGSGEIFNIGTGIATSTSALYDEISRQLGSEIRPIPAPARNGDLRLSLLDYSKAETKLGWKPIYNVQDGITEVIKYFKDKQQR